MCSSIIDTSPIRMSTVSGDPMRGVCGCDDVDNGMISPLLLLLLLLLKPLNSLLLLSAFFRARSPL